MTIGSLGRAAAARRSSRSARAGMVISGIAGWLMAALPCPTFGNPCPPDPKDPNTHQPLIGSVVSFGDSIGSFDACVIGDSSKNGGPGALELGGKLSVAPQGSLTVSTNGTLVIDDGGELAVAGVVGGIPGGIMTVRAGGLVSVAPGGELASAAATTNGGFFNNTGNLAFAIGSLNNSGVISNLKGATLLSFDGEVVTQSGSLVNDALMGLTGKDIAPTLFTNTGFITNHATGTITLTLFSTLYNAKSISNDGNLTVVSETSVLANQSGGLIDNTETGILTNFGSLGTEESSSITNAGRITNNKRFDTAGSLKSNGIGAKVSNLGTWTNRGTVSSGTGALFSNAGSFVNQPNGVIDNLIGAQFDNSGQLTNQGGGAFSKSGQIVNVGTFLNTGKLVNDGVLANVGHFGNTGAGTLSNSGTITNTGTMTNSVFISNLAGATFDNQGLVVNDSSFLNQGTVELSGTISGNGHYTQTSGLTKLRGGTISQAAIDIRGGSLLGEGNLSTLHLGASAIAGPGDPHLLTITDSLAVDGGELLFQMAGTGAGQYDRIQVGNGITWNGGHIVFEFIDGYRPAAGDSFSDFLTARGGITGLASVDYRFMGAGSTLRFAVQGDGAGDLSLRVAAVPEPGTGLLWLLGLAPLGAAMRRRHASHGE